MFVRVKTTPNSPRKSVQICESKRVGDKVSQTIVRHVGIAMDDAELKALCDLAEVIRIKLEAERKESLPLFAPEEMAVCGQNTKKVGRKPKVALPVEEVRLNQLEEEARVIEGIQEVFGKLYCDLGFDRILPQKAQSQALQATVLARVANPQSKHRTAALLEEDFAISIPLDRIYRMMDVLYQAKDKVQQAVYQATMSLFPQKVDVVFFDVTTLYFESVEADQLREFGYSKDQKFHSVQVVLALATTDKGLPIGYKLFPGNTAEVSTLLACVEEWRRHIAIGDVLLVADRAMMSERNLAQLEQAGVEYIVAAALRKMKADLQEDILDEKDYRLATFEGDCAWVKEFNLPNGRRLITNYSARRAKKDASDRKRLLEKLEKKLGKNQKAPVKRLISNQGYLKYTLHEGQSLASINEDKVALDAMWDGMHGVITNSKRDALEILARYRRLFTIEAAFRVSKHDLKLRPIYHFKPERIEAHVAICFLAYALVTQAQYRVSLQQQPMSVEVMRNELLRVQASILKDKTTGARYRLPSSMNQTARRIYRAFGLERKLSPTLLDAE